jgi:hypothetical protein
MSIINQLSSQMGDRTEKSNLKVVEKCLENPALLTVISDGLDSQEAALAGDCAEVLTEVAKVHPEWIAPHAMALSKLLAHKTSRVRWEAMHALALVARTVPEVIGDILPRLAEIIRSDSSVIARDYAVEAVGNYAGTSAMAAQAAYLMLVEALTLWDEKQAAQALEGLAKVPPLVPELGDELWGIGIRYHDHRRARVRKAATKLTKVSRES